MNIQFADLIETAPALPGVYQMFDESGILLYVGKAKNISARLKQYSNPDKLSYHKKVMRGQVARVEFITTNNEYEALLLESDLIKNTRPRYNILLTDDKMYPMLAISADKFPRMYKFRSKNIPKKDVFGPYSGIGELNQTIKLIQKVCKLRTCTNSYMNNRTRPCLLHQIGRCCAPCMFNDKNPDKTNEIGYGESVDLARKILSGNTEPIVRKLSDEMQSASAQMNFESAASIRDQITALSGTVSIGKYKSRDVDFFVIDDCNSLAIAKMRGGQILSHQIIHPKNTDDMTTIEIITQAIMEFSDKDHQIITNVSVQIPNINIINKPNDDYIQTLTTQLGLNKKIFTQKSVKWGTGFDALEKWLGIKIERIDVFDNSHLFGKNPVGAMIVAGRVGFVKSEYRNYKLENTALAGNDIGMMGEFLTRRLSDKNAINPSLIIVDGGRAQWNIAHKLVGGTIPVLGIVKGDVRNGDEHFILPNGEIDESVPKNSELFLILRALRDEAHRFVISFHRKTRSKNAIASTLDEIDGIGGERKKSLLRHFGSVDKIANANMDAIAKVPGISKSTALKIYLFFHPESV